MAESLANVDLAAGTWVDLNDATSISVGDAMVIQNLGGDVVKLVKKTTGTPTDANGFNKLRPTDEDNSWIQVDAGEPTIWAWSRIATQINVQ